MPIKDLYFLLDSVDLFNIIQDTSTELVCF